MSLGTSKNIKETEQPKKYDISTQGKLKCVYTNIDGLNKLKGGELGILLNHVKPHLVFITETKTDENQVIAQFVECKDYTVFRKDRKTG